MRLFWLTGLAALLHGLAFGASSPTSEAACRNAALPQPYVVADIPGDRGYDAVPIDYRTGTHAERVALVRVRLGIGGSLGQRHALYIVEASSIAVPIAEGEWPAFQTLFNSLFASIDRDRGIVWSNPLRDLAETRLRISGAEAGGTCCFDPSYFAAVWLERVDGRVCVGSALRHPFEGEVRHCGRIRDGEGWALYAAGFLSADEAREASCPSFLAASGRSECASAARQLTPMRLGDGRLAYVVTRTLATGRTTVVPPGHTPWHDEISRVFISVVDACTHDVFSMDSFEAAHAGIEPRRRHFVERVDFGPCP